MSNFNYNREEFIQAKALALFDANLTATTNSILSTVSKPFLTPNLASTLETSGDAFINCPVSDITEVDFELLETCKTLLNTTYEAISAFNAKMDEMASVISEKVDPDLANELLKTLKEIEEEAVGDYLDLAMSGAALDSMELYNLLSKYKDDPTLELTEDQRKMFDLLIKDAETRIEYENMSGVEKLIQNRLVFGASLLEGVVSVGENIVDGAVVIGGQVVGLGALAIGGEEAREDVVTAVANFADIDFHEIGYDAFIDASGLNQYVAYGPAHKLGFSTGRVVGDSLIAMIPGGTAVQVALAAAKAAGESMEETRGEGSAESRVDRATLAAASEVADAGIDLIDNETVKAAVSFGKDSLVNFGDNAIDYGLGGETEDPSMRGFFQERGADMAKEEAKLGVNFAKSVIGSNTPEEESTPQTTFADRFEGEFEDNAKDAVKDTAKDAAKSASSAMYEQITNEEEDVPDAA